MGIEHQLVGIHFQSGNHLLFKLADPDTGALCVSVDIRATSDRDTKKMEDLSR